MLWLRLNNFAPLIFAMIVFAQALWADTKSSTKARACEVILKAVDDVLLYSDVRDRGKVIHLSPQQALRYEWSADKDGGAVNITSQEALHNQEGETLISAWAPSSSALGSLYAVAVESGRQTGDFHHSSFNGNQALYGAWSMLVDQGRIRQLSDSSGHYQPTPYHMYLIAEHLLSQGFDLSQAQVAFTDGLGRVNDLRIEAEVFLKAMRKRSSLKQKNFLKVISDINAFHEFLDLIYRESSDQKSKILVDLYWIRMHSPDGSLAHIKSFAEKISETSLRREDLEKYLRLVFRPAGGSYFPYAPAYFGTNAKVTESTLSHIKRILLSHIQDPEKQKEIKSLIQQIRN